MPNVNRWKKYLQEAIGEDLRKENEPLIHLSQVAKLRDVDIVDALSSLFLGPLMPLYVTSPSFKKEIDVATQILPNIEGLVLNPQNAKILNAMFKALRPKSYDYSTQNAKTALAFIKAKYPKLSSLVNNIEFTEDMFMRGTYDPRTNTIRINVSNPSQPIYKFAEAIAHELMHAYQQRKDPRRFLPDSPYEKARMELFRKLVDQEITKEEFYKQLRNIPEEIQATRAGNTAINAYLKFLDLIERK